MRFSDLIKLAFRNLFRRKARTALTVVGVIIGTISIVVMVSIGIGVNEAFDESIMQNGVMTMISIEKYGIIYDDEGNYQGESEQKLGDELVEQLKKLDHVRGVSPVFSVSIRLGSGKYFRYCNVQGIDSSMIPKFGFPGLQSGSYPTKENRMIVFPNDTLSRFGCFSGNNVQFKDMDLAKDKVSFTFDDYSVHPRKKELTIPLNEQNASFFEETDNWDFSSTAYADIDYLKEIWKEYANTLTVEDRKKALAEIENYNLIKVNVDNINNVVKVQQAIKEMGYQSYSDMEYLQPMKDIAKTLELVLGAIGSVAMLVSAINIANTMIMSIYERTKEIGIMKVLGCSVRDIKRQFLLEAGFIGLAGGILGVGFSFLLSDVLNKYGSNLLGGILSEDASALEGVTRISVIPFWLPFAAAAFGVMIGLLSGYFPARRATRIRAIEAMKTEG